MEDESQRPDPMSGWIAENPVPAVALVIGFLVVFGLVLGSVDDDDPVLDAPPTTSAPQAVGETTTASTTRPDDPNRPDVPQIDCQALITGDEADAVLFDDATGPRGMFTFARGETCRFQSTDESSDHFVQIEPGSPADFDAGALIAGVPPEPVDGIGEAARWFDDRAAGVGVLSVGTSVEVGSLIYRVHVGRADLDGPERLDIARHLASLALPRFPLVVVEEPEPEVVTFDEEPADLPPLSLDQVLYEGVDAGEWSLGEGLVTLLGEMVDGADPWTEHALDDPSATGIILAAIAYSETDGPEATEVETLVDQLFPSPEQMDARTAPDETATDLSVSLVDLAQPAPAEEDDVCVATAEAPCYVKILLEGEGFEGVEAGKYVLRIAQPSAWTGSDVETAKQALYDAAVAFESLGAMPPTNLTLEAGDGLATWNLPGEDCRANVGDFLAGSDPTRLEQILARELAFCLIANDLYDQLWQNPNPVRWLVYGLATYLSGVVYPNADVEHDNLPDRLAQVELGTTMPERTWTNWIFFEHAHGFMDAAGVMGMLRGFPDKADLVANLSAASGIAEIFHDLERALSDANVSDLGAGTVPYAPQAWELSVSGPTEVPMTVPQFGVRRLHLRVPPGEYACADSFTQGAVRMSWRPGAPGDPGSWSDELPGSFENEAVIVLTSVEPGAHYTLDVVDVDTDPDCEDEDDGGGSPSDAFLELCEEICDPSEFFQGPMDFNLP